MKELKFRIWDKIKKTLSPVRDYLIFFDNGEILPIQNYLILEQYTELKDKNGKEIYEGDIVKYKEWFNGFGDNYTDMEWIAEMECNKFDNETSGGADGDIWYTDIEIIGNIHTGEDK